MNTYNATIENIQINIRSKSLARAEKFIVLKYLQNMKNGSKAVIYRKGIRESRIIK